MASKPKHPLSSAFASEASLEILAYVSLNPQATAKQIISAISVKERAFRDDIRTLVRLGLVDRTSGPGNVIFYQLGSNTIARNFSAIALAAFGVSPVLSRELGPVPGVERIIAFGPTAEYLHRLRLEAPESIEVLVLGSATRDDVDDALDRAETALGREVWAQPAPVEAWDALDDRYLQVIAKGPWVDIPLDPI